MGAHRKTIRIVRGRGLGAKDLSISLQIHPSRSYGRLRIIHKVRLPPTSGAISERKDAA